LLPYLGKESNVSVTENNEENRAPEQEPKSLVCSEENRAFYKEPTSMICLMANTKMKKKGMNIHDEMVFDGQTYLMAVDTGCSFCITNDDRHFVGEVETVSMNVKGIGGKQVVANKKGTVKWSYLNDDGCVHDQYIPNTYYNKESPYCLYSPQHVAQMNRKHSKEL
jgi:hypothetical protein